MTAAEVLFPLPAVLPEEGCVDAVPHAARENSTAASSRRASFRFKVFSSLSIVSVILSHNGTEK